MTEGNQRMIASMAWLDLSRALPTLEAIDRFRDTGAAIRRIWSLYSVRTDLAFARAAIEHLMRIGPRPGEGGAAQPADAVVFDSLLVNSVVSYCRAVHSKAESGRLPMLGLRHLSPEEREQHELIVDLRNKVIAHHGYGEFHPEVPWLKDAVTFRFTERGASIRAPHIRINGSVETMRALDVLTARAITRFDELEREMRVEVGNLMREGFKDAEFRKIVLANGFDGPAFYGDHPGWDKAAGDFTLAVGERNFWAQG